MNVVMKHATFSDFAPPATDGRLLQQHASYAKMLSLIGASYQVLNVPQGHDVLVQERRFGPFGSVKMVSGGLQNAASPLEYLRRHSVRVINPATPMATALKQAGFRQIMTPAHLAWLRLGPEPQRLNAMKGKWRNRLRAAQTSDLTTTISPFHPINDRWLLTNETAQQKTKRYRGWPTPLILAYAQANPGNVWIAKANIKRDVVAAMLFMSHRPRITYHIGWTSDAGRRHNAHTLLLHSAATHFQIRGFTRMDLGLIETETAPTLARFKIGAGARVDTLGGTWLHLPLFRKARLAAH